MVNRILTLVNLGAPKPALRGLNIGVSLSETPLEGFGNLSDSLILEVCRIEGIPVGVGVGVEDAGVVFVHGVYFLSLRLLSLAVIIL